MMFMRVKKLKEINIIAHVFRNYWNNKKSLRIVARAGMLRGRSAVNTMFAVFAPT